MWYSEKLIDITMIKGYYGAHLFALAVFVVQILFTFSESAFTNISTDQSALLALKSQITRDPYHILSNNWSVSTSVCSWAGVSCGSRHHRVTALDISSMGLAGNLPPEVGNLSFLVTFNLSRNYFRGNLPQEMSRLRRLQVMDFSVNNFTGELPFWFPVLAHLKFLYLTNNSFSGPLPNSITNITKLERLDLSLNFLHGEIPRGIGNVHSLKRLSLQDNQFNGLIPMEVFNISNLEILALARNSFSGGLPSDVCHGIPWIQELRLSENELSGLIPSTISQCSRLRILSLSLNKLTGPIPRGMGNISAMEILFLRGNNIDGEIPRELGNLWNLKHLSLGSTFLTGSIPGSIFNITSLQSIETGNCTLKGVIPPEMCPPGSQLQFANFHDNELMGQLPDEIGQCSRLDTLVFTYNNMTGSIPSSIGNPSMLIWFYIDDNNFNGKVPEEIGNLLKLEYLDMSFNNLSGWVLDKIFNISTLQVVSVLANNLSGSIPKSFGYRLPNLRYLNLGRNVFTGPIPESISNSSNLAFITFHYNNFSGHIPASLGKLRFLERLHLANNSFISESREFSIITSLANCTNLDQLSLGWSPTLNGTLPVTIGNLSSSLRYLYIHGAGLFGRIPSEICNLRSLILLDLSENQLTGPIPENLASMQKLQLFSLGNNKLSGTLPNSICELQNLEFLSLDRNQIEGSIPDCIGELTTLRHLYIYENRLSSDIPMRFWQLSDLLYLYLSSNFLSGSLPPDIENMKSLVELDLSKNQFSSNIPISVGNLQNLKNLSLADNRFLGSIPESMGNMLSLENLNLSHNSLSGSIPNSLELVQHLSYCDVSFNELSGQIPSNGSFRNFTSHLFVFNEGLCGDPKYGVPPCRSTGTRRSEKRKIKIVLVCTMLGIVLLASVTTSFILARYKRKSGLSTQTSIQITIAPIRVLYHDIETSTEGFNESHLIGVGGFSSVYKGTLQDRRLVAIKVMDLKVEGAYTNFDTECELLSSLRHRNLCKIIGVCSTENFKGLVLEYMSNGNLEKWLYSEDCFLDLMERVSIMVEVACALEYLHHGYSVPVIHRDLKPSNVLLDENMVARLSDFGISKLLNAGDSFAQSKTLATFGYIAPEYGSEGLVSTRSDVYSYGIMLMEVFTRMQPSSETFVGDFSLKGLVHESWPNEIVQVTDSRLFSYEDELYAEKLECLSYIMELALKCSMENPNERISMKDVVVKLRKIQMKFFTYSPENRRVHATN